MKRKLCCFLALLMLFSTAVVPVALAEDGGYGYYGDVNNDKSVNAVDALMTLKYAVGKQELTDTQVQSADTDGNGGVNAADALQILQFSVGKLKSWRLDTEEYTDPYDTYENYVDSDFDYNTSLSVNGAYANDTTADCSFVMDNTGLAPKTIYIFNSGVITDTDRARLVYSLQGLINRDFGRDSEHTSLLYARIETSDSSWLEVLKAEGSVYEGYEEVVIRDWSTFYTTFENQLKYCGIILWDGNVPATANVAATICGLDGYLPVLAKSPFHDELVAAGIEVKQSLVDMFVNGQKGKNIVGTTLPSTGSAKNDAYRWAMEKYFHRCSANYLAYILDGACTIRGYEAYEDNPTALLSGYASNCLSNHDYLIARRCFFFDLQPYKDDEVCDDVTQQYRVNVTCSNCTHVNSYTLDEILQVDDPVCASCSQAVTDIDYGNIKAVTVADIGTDNATMLMLFDMRYQRAKGGMGQLMGFPPWWLKYTESYGQGSKAATWIEWLYCEYISCYNLAKEADAAHPCSMTNGSAYYKYVPLSASYDNNWEEYYQQSGLTYDDDTFYYTIYMGDYDSSAWMKSYVYQWFIRGDRIRQSLPITWCFNPNLSNRIPMAFEYVYANKYQHEFVAAGDSGAGYVIPSGLSKATNLSYSNHIRPTQYASGVNAWSEYCQLFFDRFDIKATGFIINGTNVLTGELLSMYNNFSTMGGLYNDSRNMMINHNGVPYVYCQNGINTSTTAETMYNHVTQRMDGYNFAAFRTVCISPTNIRGILNKYESYAQEKGLNVQYVELYSFLELAKESGQGVTVQ